MCGAAACDRPIYARGYCGRHYKQLLRHGEVQPDRTTSPCGVVGCERAAVTRGWCHGHYLRWSRGGDLRVDIPLARPHPDGCVVPGCERGRHSAQYCRSHYKRFLAHGDATAGGPLRERGGSGSLSHGYWKVPVPPDERHLVPAGRTTELEHRLVMARLLGRALLPTEVVHHLSGDRLDNRPQNLELWNTAQPKGQRVSDKLTFAYELLRLYVPDAAAALGLDLDPTTGLPVNGAEPAS